MIHYSFSLNDLEYFLLILVRCASFIFIAPFFSMNGVPARVRAGLSIFLAILLYSVTSRVDVEYSSVFTYALLVLKETVTGLLIGYSTTICTSVVSFAGRIIDMEVGLSMISLMDPTTRQETSITGVYYQYAFTLMMIISGMYQYILKAFAETYTLIPVNGAIFHSDKLMAAMIQFMSSYIMIGFRICLPVFAVMMLLNAVLGIMAKVAPQMNMFSVGMQLKVLVGLGILFFTTSMLPGLSDYIFTMMKQMTVAFVEAIM